MCPFVPALIDTTAMTDRNDSSLTQIGWTVLFVVGCFCAVAVVWAAWTQPDGPDRSGSGGCV